MNAVQETFWEVGAKYPVFSPADVILRVSIWFVENDVESWDKLQAHVDDIYLEAAFENAILEMISRFFMYIPKTQGVDRTQATCQDNCGYHFRYGLRGMKTNQIEWIQQDAH
jgi:hypothetical protein